MKFFRLPFEEKKYKLFKKRAEKVIREGQYINGPEVAELEQKLSAYFKMPFISCNSGTDALAIGLQALGIGKGDEVITTAFTFFATLEAIHHAGAIPVFADIDPRTYNINPADIERWITKKTKAILVVHLFGLACDMTAITRLCRKHKLLLVEDAAQSFGAMHKGKLTGTFGDLGCFSFFPTKNLGGFGDGGGVTIRKKAYADAFRSLKSHGQSVRSKYDNERMGYNSRLDTLQAGLLLERMKFLAAELKERKRSARAWCERLRVRKDVIHLPEDREHTYNQFSILVRDRAKFVEYLKAEGVPHMVYYPTPLYRQSAYVTSYGRLKPLPNTEYVSKHIVSLPVLS